MGQDGAPGIKETNLDQVEVTKFSSNGSFIPERYSVQLQTRTEWIVRADIGMDLSIGAGTVHLWKISLQESHLRHGVRKRDWVFADLQWKAPIFYSQVMWLWNIPNNLFLSIIPFFFCLKPLHSGLFWRSKSECQNSSRTIKHYLIKLLLLWQLLLKHDWITGP